jgi:hypothetical protein
LYTVRLWAPPYVPYVPPLHPLTNRTKYEVVNMTFSSTPRFQLPSTYGQFCYINTLPRVETVMIREQSQIMTALKKVLKSHTRIR